MHKMSIFTSFVPPLIITISSNFSSVELNNLDTPSMLHNFIGEGVGASQVGAKREK